MCDLVKEADVLLSLFITRTLKKIKHAQVHKRITMSSKLGADVQETEKKRTVNKLSEI